MEETEFRLSERFFPYFRRMTLTRILPVLVVAILVAVFAVPGNAEMNPAMMVVMAVVLALAVGFGGWRGLRRQEASFRGFRVRLDADSIRRVQPGLPDLLIPKDRISRIIRVPGKGMTVFGAGRQEILGIPEALESFAVVESTLKAWHPFEIRKPSLASWAPMLVGLGTVVIFALVIMSSNRLFVTIAGGALILLMIYSTVALYRSKHVDARNRRFVWFMPLVTLAIAVRIWMAWTR